MVNRVLIPALLGLMAWGFWASADFQEIAAGVAIFLFGMFMLEDGFKLFAGGFLETVLARATASLPRALCFGVLSTTVMQSSSLVSILAISFLSTGLITLTGGIGIIFGANVGTTTGAWLVAGLGLKVDISAYALPMLALSIVLVFQRNKYWRGTGLVLAGLGFLFLGIHFMKGGFEALRDGLDLARFAMTGAAGLAVFTCLGMLATIIMQSSHATMVLVLTALAAGQLTYDNALALAIGSNIGTTITAILGAMTANFQGKRLALAHFVFNVLTAAIALVFLDGLRAAVEVISAQLEIAPTNHALRLAVFHSLFNILGVALTLPLLRPLTLFLKRGFPESSGDLSRPKYLTPSAERLPHTARIAMRKEVGHLMVNAFELILHGLNLHRHQVFETRDVAATVRDSHHPFDLDLDQRYEARIKTLHSAIVGFTTRVGARNLPEDVLDDIYTLREVAGRLVRAVKSVKHMRSNASRFTEHPQGAVTDLYNQLRTEIARILIEIDKLERSEPSARSGLWLDQELLQVEKDAHEAMARVEELIRARQITPGMATSFLNDSGYAHDAMRDMLRAARAFYFDTRGGLAELESILEMEEDELKALARARVDRHDDAGEK